MGTDVRTAEFILEQIADAGDVSVRKMFGEYAVYCDGKMPALICDDQLFVKPTKEGRDFAGVCAESPPYRGAKPHLLIEGDRWDDAEWLSNLIRITTSALPIPKPKKSKKAKS